MLLVAVDGVLTIHQWDGMGQVALRWERHSTYINVQKISKKYLINWKQCFIVAFSCSQFQMLVGHFST